MTPAIIPPGVYVQDVKSGTPPITGVPTAITAFIGRISQGPIDHAEPISSWLDYTRVFGGLDANSLVSYAVYFFFTNGGKQAYVVRAIRPKDGALPGQAQTKIAGAVTTRAKVLPTPTVDRARNGPTLPPITPLSKAEIGTGLALLEKVDLFNLLCVPGEVEEDAMRDLQDLCYRRRAFLIIDSRSTDTCQGLTDSGVDDLVEGRSSANAALYFPWVQVADPLNEQRAITLPPSGFVAGMISRIDSERGVWKAPAGLEAKLLGTVGLKEAIEDSRIGQLNVGGINCIRNYHGSGIVVWGSRTLLGSDHQSSEWKYIPVRRLALFLEESIYRGTQWAVFEPNDEPLWSQIRSGVGSFMMDLFRRGAFRGNTPHEAYFVKCDRETTFRDELNNEAVYIEIGFAPLKPAEFVVIRIQQKVGVASNPGQ
jgi:uncharacterized protein